VANDGHEACDQRRAHRRNGVANAFLIESDDGLTLIDAGYPRKQAAVFAAIRALGRSADQLKHLILTHGHPDHIGSGAAIVRETAARTYMHPLDIPHG
jgi:glyoxylase-like metal-dependent hydrolase (beta-lactamase superfamily II)